MERFRFGRSSAFSLALARRHVVTRDECRLRSVGCSRANFTTMTLSQSQGSPFFGGFVPPDTMGAAGPSNFIEFTNGSMVNYNKLGQQCLGDWRLILLDQSRD